MIKKTLLKTTSMITLAMTIMAYAPDSANAAWKQSSTRWYFTEGNSYATGWRQISGIWYYFDANGYMETGWVNDGGSWYYMNSSGAMQTGWIYYGSSWYYLNQSGVMQTGWLKDGSSWYYLDGSGAMLTSWIDYGSNKYYLNNSGVMQTGLITVGPGIKYYLDDSGAMVTGRQEINNAWYYFYPDGCMAKDSFSDDYYYDKSGICTTPKITITKEDSVNLVNKNDSEAIEAFKAMNNTETIFSNLRVNGKGQLSDYINIEDAGIKNEAVYRVELIAMETDYSDSYSSVLYLVGGTSGDVYALPNQGGCKIYKMKDNKIVGSYFFTGTTTGEDWR